MEEKIEFKDWEQMFKQDIKDKLIESKKEFDVYKSTGKIVYLQQAGNKLFSVVENFMMLKYKTRVRGYQDLRELVKDNTFDKRLLSKTAQLHYFFYSGTVQGEPDEFADMYLEIYEVMKSRVK